jgi:hypothetical protein
MGSFCHDRPAAGGVLRIAYPSLYRSIDVTSGQVLWRGTLNCLLNGGHLGSCPQDSWREPAAFYISSVIVLADSLYAISQRALTASAVRPNSAGDRAAISAQSGRLADARRGWLPQYQAPGRRNVEHGPCSVRRGQSVAR